MDEFDWRGLERGSRGENELGLCSKSYRERKEEVRMPSGIRTLVRPLGSLGMRVGIREVQMDGRSIPCSWAKRMAFS